MGIVWAFRAGQNRTKTDTKSTNQRQLNRGRESMIFVPKLPHLKEHQSPLITPRITFMQHIEIMIERKVGAAALHRKWRIKAA